jgi:hypothetical protein
VIGRDLPVLREPAADRAGAAAAEASALNLCIRLHLDALLLILGAAAAGEPAARRPSRAGPARFGGSVPAPWRRWLERDLDLVYGLAVQALAEREGAALAAAAGAQPHRTEPAAAVNALADSHQAMAGQLAELSRARPDQPGWVHRSLERYRQGLAELQHRPRSATSPDGRTAVSSEHHYLPGELLG